VVSEKNEVREIPREIPIRIEARGFFAFFSVALWVCLLPKKKCVATATVRATKRSAFGVLKTSNMAVEKKSGVMKSGNRYSDEVFHRFVVLDILKY
jgi:hypothetical protein